MNQTQSLPLSCSVKVNDLTLKKSSNPTGKPEDLGRHRCSGSAELGFLAQEGSGAGIGEKGVEGGNYRPWDNRNKSKKWTTPPSLVLSRSRVILPVLKAPATWPNNCWNVMCTLERLSRQVPISKMPSNQPYSLAMPIYDSLRATNVVPESGGPKKHSSRYSDPSGIFCASIMSLRRWPIGLFPYHGHKTILSLPQGLGFYGQNLLHSQASSKKFH